MSNHTEFAELAEELIAENGRTVTVVTRINIGSVYDPLIEEVELPCLAVNVKMNKAEAVGLIEDTDFVFLLDARIAISTRMRIKDGDELFSIVDVKQIKPGEQNCMYKVFCRK